MDKIFVFIILVSSAASIIGTPYYIPPPYPGKCLVPPYNASGSHSLFVGCVTHLDRLLYHQTIIKTGKWFSGRTALIRYPLPGYWRNEIITGVWIFDHFRNGTGGYPHIVSGGVGRRNVTIELSSKPFKGFHFEVSIYGH